MVRSSFTFYHYTCWASFASWCWTIDRSLSEWTKYALKVTIVILDGKITSAKATLQSHLVSWFQTWPSDQFTLLLHYLRKQICYMLRRVLIGYQPYYAIDARIDRVNERQHFVHTAIWPIFQLIVDNVFERPNIELCKCRLLFTVCGVSVNAIAFTELFER